MLVVFSTSPFPPCVSSSIFLAGPSPRNWDASGPASKWRHEALDILTKLGYRGVVYIPIPKDKFYGPNDVIGAYEIYDPTKQQAFVPVETVEWDYDSQVEWELKARARSDVEVFWVDRRMPETPGLTTNVEFGQSLPFGKVVYGRPDDADNIRYLDQCFVSDLNSNKIHPEPFTTLDETLSAAVKYINGFADKKLCGANMLRYGHNTQIPLYLWTHPPFRNWLESQTAAGNSVKECNIKQAFFIAGKLFSAVIHVKIWCDREERYKDNEFIITRPDISAVVPFVYANGAWNVLLVSEFRSPVRNNYNMVIEVPSGSSFNPKKTAIEIALEELEEETGVKVDEFSLCKVGEFQLASTLSVHTVNLYCCILDYPQIKHVVGTTTGNAAESERTTVMLVPVSDVVNGSCELDMSCVGMIVRAARLVDVL